jgi:hypothetical protein
MDILFLFHFISFYFIFNVNTEITSFDLLGDYSNTPYLRNQNFLFAYKFVFLVALTHRYVTFFNQLMALPQRYVTFFNRLVVLTHRYVTYCKQLVALSHRYLTFFTKSLRDILVNSMTFILAKLKTRFGYINNTGLLDIHSSKPKND